MAARKIKYTHSGLVQLNNEWTRVKTARKPNLIDEPALSRINEVMKSFSFDDLLP